MTERKPNGQVTWKYTERDGSVLEVDDCGDTLIVDVESGMVELDMEAVQALHAFLDRFLGRLP